MQLIKFHVRPSSRDLRSYTSQTVEKRNIYFHKAINIFLFTVFFYAFRILYIFEATADLSYESLVCVCILQ